MPSQLAAYEDLVRAAHKAGYAQTSVRQYYDMVSKGRFVPDKVIIHRHDIEIHGVLRAPPWLSCESAA